MLTCERAGAVLSGLEKNALACEAEEIEELLALGLAVECDPEDLAVLGWLQPVVREMTRHNVGDPQVIGLLEEQLAKTNKDLTSDWYRMTTGRATIEQREQDKVQIQRALGLLRDPHLVEQLRKILEAQQQLGPNTPWVACAALGVEHYAITMKGRRLLRALGVRIARFQGVGFKSFVHSYDKTANKMRAFGSEIATLSNNIGFVKKNREQVVIGLAKTGVPASHALGAYHAALHQVQAPDVAVTCARNVKAFGSPQHAAQRLHLAKKALLGAGYPNIPIAMGAAKSLLAFSPPESGVPRFRELMQRLEQVFGRTEQNYKYTTRLMPGSGSPAELVKRVTVALHLLRQTPSRVSGQRDFGPSATALASMVKTDDALPDLVRRFRELETLLVQGGISLPSHVEGDALECVACPGTPAEVVDTVSGLIEQIAPNRQPQRGDVAIAASFAKRFAY